MVNITKEMVKIVLLVRRVITMKIVNEVGYKIWLKMFSSLDSLATSVMQHCSDVVISFTSEN